MIKLKAFIYIFIFSITLILTFPTKTIISYLLTSKNFLFSKVEGNLFNLKINNLENKDFLFRQIIIKNKIFIQNININNTLKINYKPFSKELYMSFYSFNPSNILKKKFLSGKINGSLNISKYKNLKLVEGKGEIFLERLDILNLKNVNIKYKLKKFKTYSEILLKLNNPNLNGIYRGKIIWKDKIEVKGIFIGEFFKQKIKKEINKDFKINFFNGFI